MKQDHAKRSPKALADPPPRDLSAAQNHLFSASRQIPERIVRYEKREKQLADDPDKVDPEVRLSSVILHSSERADKTFSERQPTFRKLHRFTQGTVSEAVSQREKQEKQKDDNIFSVLTQDSFFQIIPDLKKESSFHRNSFFRTAFVPNQ